MAAENETDLALWGHLQKGATAQDRYADRGGDVQGAIIGGGHEQGRSTCISASMTIRAKGS